jgi:hypothetical protein
MAVDPQSLMPMPDGSEETWKTALAGHEHPALLRYVELVAASLESGPASAPQYWPDAEWAGVMTQLRTAIEAFVLAEPLVHLALRHPEASERLPLSDVHPEAESYLWSEAQRNTTFVMRIAATAAVFDNKGFDESLGCWASRCLC